MAQWENTNDIIYSISKRAGELANYTMDDLRQELSSDPYGRLGSARSEFKYRTKGDLIDTLLTEEFIEEHPRLLEEE
jgi:hypothetical protein